MRLLAEAVEEMEDEDQDEDDEDRDSETKSAGGPYGTILHTAAAVGNDWLVILQMKAGVDVSAYDSHFWTALMVATAQGHASCIKLLSEHVDTRKVKAAPPSGLVKAQLKSSISLGPTNLTVTANSWSSILVQQRIQLRSDHPIPPHFRIFYYEIEILNNGPLGCVHTCAIQLLYTNSSFFSIIGLGLCRPETPAFGMPGHAASSWGYHGDDGKKFNNPLGVGLRYNDSYNTGDTVGCGINIKTGKLFFTKNGVNLGKDLLHSPYGAGVIGLKSLTIASPKGLHSLT